MLVASRRRFRNCTHTDVGMYIALVKHIWTLFSQVTGVIDLPQVLVWCC